MSPTPHLFSENPYSTQCSIVFGAILRCFMRLDRFMRLSLWGWSGCDSFEVMQS